MTKKTAYKVDVAKKLVTIDDDVKMTAADAEDVKLYLAAGYVLKHKSAVRASIAKQRAIDGWTKETMIAKLEAEDKEAAEKFKTICAGKGKGQGYFAGKVYFKAWLADHPEAEK